MKKPNIDNYTFTSESVAEGHPDKMCDQISDAILDLFMSKDPFSRTAIECFATTNRLIIGGEINSTYKLDKDEIDSLARATIKDIGYEQKGFHWQNVNIECLLHKQSPDISQGVDVDGAGDQGIMFGYACNETQELMPAPIVYSHKLLRSLSDIWKKDKNLGLGPDAKSQVSLHYRDSKPVNANAIVLSVQHREDLQLDYVKDYLINHIRNVMPQHWDISEDMCYINPTGRFVIGGPEGDAGLTGRKIIVDTYGGRAPHGGGAFSGKDPTKVDRSAAYMARYLAKNIVASKLADECVIQIAYAIGITKPVSLYINCFGSEKCDLKKLNKKILEMVDLSPQGIRKQLNLSAPIYQITASYGHFGRSPTDSGKFPWEKTDLVEQLAELLS